MNDYFHFKQFSVSHKRSSMKVGTDGVLLGAWVSVERARHMLDIGSGTGIIALMLAQRTGSHTLIDAVEIEPAACMDASENFQRSPWKQKLTLHSCGLQHFRSARKYDLIVSNPPYFNNSYKPPDPNRKAARHTDTLTSEELVNAALQVLAPKGRLAVILPFNEAQHFQKLATIQNLQCIRQCAFRSRPNKPVERLLMEFSTVPTSLHQEELCLYHKNETWSDEYKALTQPFYLNI